MPLSKDGRWNRICARLDCRRRFDASKVNQHYCSQDCANKVHPGRGGRKPADIPERDCPTCGRRFQPYRKTQLACSRACRDAMPEYREKIRAWDNKPARRERQNELRRGSAKAAASRRKRGLERSGWTVEEYEQALIAQNGRCQICGREPDPAGVKAASKLHADHDHRTGKRRDLLCGQCNAALGMMNDDPELLSVAADYILRHRQLHWGQFRFRRAAPLRQQATKPPGLLAQEDRDG